MAETCVVRAPDLGATTPIRVSAWLVEAGETVRAGDRLVELLLPGLTYDVPAPVSGWLIDIREAANAEVGPGDVLCHIREADDV